MNYNFLKRSFGPLFPPTQGAAKYISINDYNYPKRTFGDVEGSIWTLNPGARYLGIFNEITFNV